MLNPYIGEICAFACNFEPRGWRFCDGRLMNISQNSALFSLLGTTYGGDGVSTFGLPDLRGRMVVGSGQGPGLSNHVPGEMSGAETVTLTSAEIPAHTHQIKISANSTTARPQDAYPGPAAKEGGNLKAYGTTPVAELAPAALQNAGNSQPHNNMPPYIVINWCIAVEGIYPSRS